jgi:hypothetical protein
MDAAAILENDTETYYVLDDRLEPVEATKEEWTAFLKTDAATIAITHIGSRAMVITTFTGVDDGFSEEGELPYLFETGGTIRGEPDDTEAHRTWAEAEEGHRARVQEMIQRLAFARPYVTGQRALPL